MKTERKVLEEYLSRFFIRIYSDNDKLNELSDFVKEKYNYPTSRLLDLISKRITASEASDFDLFVLMDGFENVISTKNKLTTYFTDDEIKGYSKQKYKKQKKAKFPLKFTMIQIAPDQWIGGITARQLILLRNNGLIRYNVNIQRTMRRGLRGKTTEYRIMENKRSTAEIRESMQAGTFIPNAITLNIPDEPDSEFSYDEESKVLTIKKANSLDIIDGFHRLIALEQAGNTDPSWDYPMELRISNYSETKGQRFVYQEDQKTKMTKIDSDSFNVEDDAVKTVQRINEDPGCIFQGQINRNNGLISMPEMSMILKRHYFTGLGKQQSRIKSFELSKQLKDDFNKLAEFDPKYATEPISFGNLYIIIVAFDWFRQNNIPEEKQADILNYALLNIDDDLNTRLKRKAATTPTTKVIVKLLEEGEENV